MTAAAPPISRGAAQRLARTELAKAIYHPAGSLTQRIEHAIGTLLLRLFQAGSSFPGGWWAVVALSALAAAVILVVLGGVGPLSRGRRQRTSLTAGAGALTAAEHRQRASRLAEAGDYSGAILESVRGIVVQLEERGVLTPRAGRTADEIAAEAGQALPGDARALQDAARLFDDVCYGERPGTADGYALVRALDTRIGAA